MSRRDPKTSEQNDFTKFIRNFCNRFVQVVVHARMGIALDQPCRPPSENDATVWFNFKQEEFGEITAYLKSAIKRYPPDVSAITVDFFLHTASGDSLPLEAWVVRIATEEVDRSVNISSLLYRQLGTLLMSVSAAARATPAGRHYTKNQSEKTYVICYRVYESEPELELLGPDYRTILIGNYPSPYGAVQVEFHYRTKMELTLAPYADEQLHQQIATNGESGMLLTASIPIKKPQTQRNRLVLQTDSKPKAKNWFNPMSDALPFVADMSRPRNQTPAQSPDAEQGIRPLYQNLPMQILAAMPAELRSPQKPTSECGSTPLSDCSVPLRAPDQFPFSSLFRPNDDEHKEQHAPQSDSTSLSNFHFSATANSSSDSSGSKRYDSDVASTASSSMRDVVRQRQLKRDEIFGFLMDEDSSTAASQQQQQPPPPPPPPPPPHVPPPSLQHGQLHQQQRARADSKGDIAFAASTSPPLLAFTPPPCELGPDLDEFLREVSTPRNITSLESDEGRWIGASLEYFKQKADALDTFVTSMQQETALQSSAD